MESSFNILCYYRAHKITKSLPVLVIMGMATEQKYITGLKMSNRTSVFFVPCCIVINKHPLITFISFMIDFLYNPRP